MKHGHCSVVPCLVDGCDFDCAGWLTEKRNPSPVQRLMLAAAMKAGNKARRVAAEAGARAGRFTAEESSRLLVVDDAALAQKIGRVKGEWEARSGAPLEVKEMGVSELAAAKSLAADVVVYPSIELGDLAERELLRPIPAAWLDRPEYAKKDLFELPGLRETAWGETTYAVPLGSPVLVLFYRTDLFTHFGKRPPQTWAEYQGLVEFFDLRDNLDAFGDR